MTRMSVAVFALLSLNAATTHAQKISVKVTHDGRDRVGTILVSDIKEHLTRSARFSLRKDTESRLDVSAVLANMKMGDAGHSKISLVSLDASNGTGQSSAVSVSFETTLFCAENRSSRFQLRSTHSVILVGRDRTDSLAREVVSRFATFRDGEVCDADIPNLVGSDAPRPGVPAVSATTVAAVSPDHSPTSESEDISDAEALGIFSFLGFYYLFLGIALVALGRNLEVTGRWRAWVPWLNFVLLLRAARLSDWWALALPVPFLNWATLVWAWHQVAKRRNLATWPAYLTWIPLVNIPAISYYAFTPTSASAAERTSTPALTPKFCTSCGAPSSLEARFCGMCGVARSATV